jgi:hypothetical protein
MRFYKVKFILISSVLIFEIINTPAIAAGSKPKVTVNCGQIAGLADESGTYGLFKPEVFVSYYGSPLKVTSYFYRTPKTKKSNTGQYIVEFTNKAPSTRYFTSKVDIQHKVLQFSQPQTGYLKFVIEVVDSLKRKSEFTCTYKDYRYSTAIISNSSGGGSSSGISSRGFNRASCTFDGKNLYGRVYFTKYSFESDFKVYLTDYSFESDFKVYLTDYSFEARSCGKWYPTKYSFESDLKIYETDYSFEAGR